MFQLSSRLKSWLLYTVLVGALPFLIRSLITYVANDVPLSYIWNEVDVVTFGLVLHISNLYELNANPTLFNPDRMKSLTVFTSIFIVLFAILLGLAYLIDASNTKILSIKNIKILSTGLGAVTVLFSASIFK